MTPYNPNDPYPQPTTAGQYPQWAQQPPPIYAQPGQPVQQKPPKPPLFDIKARQAYYKQYPLSKKQSFAVGCGTLLGVFLLCGICSAMGSGNNSTKQVTMSSPAQPTHQVPALATERPKKPTATPKPSPTPAPTPAPTPEPAQPVQQQPVQQPPMQQAPVQQSPVHSAGDKDCKDFATHAEAQRYFVSKGGSPSNNVDNLDSNHNGIACEALP